MAPRSELEPGFDSYLAVWFRCSWVATSPARLGGTFNGWLHGLATWATVAMLTILLLTTAAGGLIGTASGLASFAVNNSDKVSRTELPPAVQQQIDQFTAQARVSADQAAAQAQQTTPEQKAAEARQVGQRAAKGGAVGTGAAAFGLILGGQKNAQSGRCKVSNLAYYVWGLKTEGASSKRLASTRSRCSLARTWSSA